MSETTLSIQKLQLKEGTVSIANSAFSGCSSLNNLIIPEGVTEIGYEAFEYCSGLESITIPKSLRHIGGNAFKRCTSLHAVYLSDIKSWFDIEFDISWDNFYPSPFSYGADLYLNGEIVTDLVIPDEVNSININTLKGMRSVRSVSIPANLTEYYEYTYSEYFDGFMALESINVDANHPSLCSEDGVLYNKDKTELIKYPYAKEGTEFTIPKTVEQLGGNSFSQVSGLKETSSYPEAIYSDCINLKEIIVKNPSLCFSENVLHLKSIIFYIHKDSELESYLEALGYNYKYICEKLGHKPVIIPAEKATCQHDGHTIGSKCEYCGQIYVEPTVIPKNSHTPVIDKQAVPPTCTETGLSESTHCSVCGEPISEQKIIPALGHNYVAISGKPATANETGLTDGIQCSRCGEWLIQQEIIPKIGYENVIGDTNLDGYITISDVTAIQRHIAELDIFSEEQLAAADTNGDGKVDITDATHLQMYLAEYDGIVLGKQPTA